MSYVPLPVRVAMGLAVTAVEQVCKLPEQLSELPVLAASRAVQAGMRVQQRVTELAIKGDQVFSLFNPVEDAPTWARFDEDDEPQSPDAEPSVDLCPDLNAATTIEAATASEFGAAGEGAVVAPDPGYDELSLAQLRVKLRKMSLPQLEALLEYEQLHQDRPAFVTLLTNRIATVRSHPTESP
ncbi:MAG: lipid droplet-associated protein [Pseudonocardiaceae bacterium]